ncbi:MAG: hypothetical protein Q8922_10350, partial [Bacteroidota bacterium]|nr:hypothetical protein [Bacteroidota bacterium]MDP4288325.1 hypothetical protein [Bacteroidota bacterium]
MTRRRASFRCVLAVWFSILILALCGVGLRAQDARIHHKIVSEYHKAPQMGRDLWFTLLTNYGLQNLSGKYFALYVTSPNTTNVYVQLTGGARNTIVVQPYKMTTFNMPLTWEMHGSGTVGPFGVHVWSDDADISAYVMSHNPATSDGMYVIPTIGWGTEYVVAAYAALNEGSGSTTIDLPSEFGIVANQDNTRVSITPTADIRVEASSGACCSCVLALKGQTFLVSLNRGESVQYESTCTQDCDNYDLTGTVLKSNNPIGVEGGSQCTNIPCDFPYCDHVVDMLPPVRTWAKSYYTLPFYQPAGASSGHQASTFLVVASKPGQVINRFDNVSGLLPVFTSSQKYDFFFLNDIDLGSRWSSKDPFELVQYINSASYPDRINGNGDPAEVVINSAEEFSKTAVFCTPISIGSQGPYTHYVNIVAKYGDTNVKFDGKSVKSFHQVYMDGIFEGYRADAVTPGTHIVTSDSGVGVYIYGYGHDESYAWTGSFANNSYNSADSTAPKADTSGQCFQAHVNLTDVDGDSNNLGLYYIRVDSSNNMTFNLDPAWVEGNAITKTFYDMTVADLSKPAILILSAFDQAGNVTTVTSTYAPQDARLGPPLQDFGVGDPSSCIVMYDTISNTLNLPYYFHNIRLARGDQGFSFPTDTTLPASPLAVGSVNLVKICFKSLRGSTVFDTLLIDDGCSVKKVLLTGTGGQPDFRTTGHDWSTQLLGTDSVWDGTKGLPIEVVNTSAVPITINSMWVDAVDSANFLPVKDSHWATPSKPVLIPAKGHDTVTFTFHTTLTDPIGPYSLNWFAKSDQLVSSTETGVRSNILTAQTVSAGTTFTADTTFDIECANATSPPASLQFVITATGSATSTITKVQHSSTEFSMFGVMRDGNAIPDPSHMNELLNSGQKLVVTEQFQAPLMKDTTFFDTITAFYIDQTDGLTKMVGGRPLLATIHVIYRSGVVTPALLTFPAVPYQGPPVTLPIAIKNTQSSETLVVDSIFINPLLDLKNQTYGKAFTFSLTGGAKWTPQAIAPNGSVTILVSFDPSISFDQTQQVTVQVNSNSCPDLPLQLVAQTTVSGASGEDYVPSGFSACDLAPRTVTIYNTKPKNADEEVADTIVKVWFTSTNSPIGKNFSVVGDPVQAQAVIHGYDSLSIPITFQPDPTVFGRQPYQDTIYVTLHNWRIDETVFVVVRDTGVTEALTATAGSGASVIGQTFTLPISFSVNNNGLAEPLANRKISQVKFTIAL